MPIDKINGVNLYWELTGNSDETLILVHGGWSDHNVWNSVVQNLSNDFRILTYDRRGHSQSERPDKQGYTTEDIDDLIELTEHFSMAPAHIVGNSFGAVITLKTAVKRSDIFKSMVLHEPPLLGMLKENEQAQYLLETVESKIKKVMGLISYKKYEEAAETFVDEIAFGHGKWNELPQNVKDTFIFNAPTWYDENSDKDSFELDLTKLSKFVKPVLMTQGTQSPPFFYWIIDILSVHIPNNKRMIFKGAGHVPHIEIPDIFAEKIKSFCLQKNS